MAPCSVREPTAYVFAELIDGERERSGRCGEDDEAKPKPSVRDEVQRPELFPDPRLYQMIAPLPDYLDGAFWNATGLPSMTT